MDRVKKRNFVLRLFMLSGFLTLCCYTWLALPPSTSKTAIPGIASYALGIGFSPRKPCVRPEMERVLTDQTVLLVIMVPRIVPLKYVSTTLGAHKAVCNTFPLPIFRRLKIEYSSSKLGPRFSRLLRV